MSQDFDEIKFLLLIIKAKKMKNEKSENVCPVRQKIEWCFFKANMPPHHITVFLL